LENAIDVVGGGNAVGNDGKRLPLDGRPNPVENEADALALNVIRLQAKPWQDVDQSFDELGPGHAA
jgi:hypothetical protein